MAQAGLGGQFQKSTGSESTYLDPYTLDLDRFRVAQMNNLQGVSPLSSAFQGYQSYMNPGDFTRTLGDVGANQAIRPGVNAADWQNLAYSGLNYFPQMQQNQQYYNTINQNLSNIGQGIQNNLNYRPELTEAVSAYGTTAQNLQNLQTQNQNYINSLAPNLYQAGANYFNELVSPQITNQFALQGLGRSGANQEAQAKAAASVMLPIQQQLAGMQQQNLAQTTGLLGQNYQNQAALFPQFGTQYLQNTLGAGLANQGLLGQSYLQSGQEQNQFGQQYLQNLYGLNQALPQNDIALRNADVSRFGQALQFSDYARQAGLAGNQGFLQGWLSLLSGTPYIPGGERFTSGTQWGLQGNAGIGGGYGGRTGIG